MSTFKDKPLKKRHTDSRQMIDKIHTDIVKDLSPDKLNQYYLENGEILDRYYKLSTDRKMNNTKTGILHYFNDSIKEEEVTNVDIINQYMCNINDSHKNKKFRDYNIDKCEQCNSIMEYLTNTSELICSRCGYTRNIIINTEKSSYNDPPKEVNYFAYKRINHFNEWLAQFQAKETTEIPEEVYKGIHDEIKKNKNIDMHKISYRQVREILKKINYNKYYEHIPHIINTFSGQPAPTLDKRSEETLRGLFKEIQIPFMNNCPPTRKNFLSYAYVLHKFCELLEYDHLIGYFPLLKSREKLQQQDLIWKKICHDLQWEFIPSV